MGFGFWGLGCGLGAWSLGFKVCSSGFGPGAQGLGGFGLGTWDLGFGAI